jgi:alkylated DNA repair dioxygenase AlkB
LEKIWLFLLNLYYFLQKIWPKTMQQQLQIFGNEPVVSHNLLPYQGELSYWPALFSSEQASTYFRLLAQQIPWQHDRVTVFGKTHQTSRKTAFFANKPLNYRYSGQIKTALPYSKLLSEIHEITEQHCQLLFNACLLNYYHSGTEGMGWHADNEPEIIPYSSIAAISFGAERIFQFRHKSTAYTQSISLANGSLLLMGAHTQAHWLHQLPKRPKITQPRISLTFRLMQ